MAVSRRWCGHCGNYVAGEKTVNHVLHLLLALITVGIWIIPWAFFTVTARYKCRRCGGGTRYAKWWPV